MDKVNIVDESGNTKEVNFITILTLEKYNSSYLVYTEAELTDGNNIVSFGKIKEKNDSLYLENIPQEELPDLQNELRKELYHG